MFVCSPLKRMVYSGVLGKTVLIPHCSWIQRLAVRGIPFSCAIVFCTAGLLKTTAGEDVLTSTGAVLGTACTGVGRGVAGPGRVVGSN